MARDTQDRRSKTRPSKHAALYVRLPFVLGLFAWGAWQIATQQASFLMGRRSGSPQRGIHVDATGTHAIVIGLVWVALSLLVLAEGLKNKARIPVFWCGAVLLLATALYGVVQFVSGLFS